MKGGYKSKLPEPSRFKVDMLGRSYYLFCLEMALGSIHQARALMKGDVVDSNHELAKIEKLILAAYEAS